MGDDLNERIRRDSFEAPPCWPPHFGPDDDMDVLKMIGILVIWTLVCVAAGFAMGRYL